VGAGPVDDVASDAAGLSPPASNSRVFNTRGTNGEV